MPVPSSPTARYRASELVGFADTDPVATWPDEIGSHDLISVNSALTTYSADGFYGAPAVEFQATSDSRMAGSTPPALGVTQPHTVAAICQLKSLVFSGGDANAIVVDSLGGPRSALYFAGNSPREYRMFAGTAEVASGVHVDLSEHLLVGIFNGASSVLRLESTEIATGDPGSDGIQRLVVNADGSQPTGNLGHADVLIAEIIVYDRALNSTELADLEDYFQTTYLDTPPIEPFARYRASSLALSDTDPVPTWADEGWGQNAIAQATGASQPAFEAAGFNGHESVLFDGTDDYLQTGSYPSVVNQPTTIVLMGEVISTTDPEVEYLFDGLGAERQALISDSSVAGDPVRMFAGSILATDLVAGDLDGVQAVYAVIFDGASSDILVNNVTELTGGGSPGSLGLGGFTLGARLDGTATGETAHMRIVEVLIYDRALTASELTDLQNYFNTTYGAGAETITVDHGIVLGHSAQVDVHTAIQVAHGLVLGHAAQIDIRSAVQVAHGLVLSHSAQIDPTAGLALAYRTRVVQTEDRTREVLAESRTTHTR